MAEFERQIDGKPEHGGRLRYRSSFRHRVEAFDPDPELAREREDEGDAERKRRVEAYAAYVHAHGRLAANLVDSLAEGQRLVDAGLSAPLLTGKPVEKALRCVGCEKRRRTADREDGLCGNCRDRVNDAQRKREKRKLSPAVVIVCACCKKRCDEANARRWWLQLGQDEWLCVKCSRTLSGEAA